MTGEETTRILRELSNGETVQVTINEEQQKYRIEHEILRSTCDILCSKIEPQVSHDGNEQPVVTFHLNLKGPKEAMGLFLYYIAKKTLPRNDIKRMSTGDAAMLLSQLWCFVDQFLMWTFQDEVMMELLKALKHETASLSVIKYALENSKEGDLIRELMAEELVWSLHEEELEYSELEIFRGIQGFLPLFTEVLETAEDFDRLEAGEQKWLKYMVGEGPGKHWAWDI